MTSLRQSLLPFEETKADCGKLTMNLGMKWKTFFAYAAASNRYTHPVQYCFD